MSTRHLRAVREMSTAGFTVAERFVLYVLADHADNEGGCFPHQNTIARETGLHRSTVNQAVKSLREKKLLKVQPRTRAGMRRGSLYTLTLPDVASDNTRCCPRQLPDVVSDNSNVKRQYVQASEEEKNVQEDPALTIPYDWLQQTWNDFAAQHKLSRVLALSEGRQDKLRTRWAEWGELDPDGAQMFFETVLEDIALQPFLLGQNPRGWTVCFDWLIANGTNALKVAEHRYIDSSPKDPMEGW